MGIITVRQAVRSGRRLGYSVYMTNGAVTWQDVKSETMDVMHSVAKKEAGDQQRFIKAYFDFAPFPKQVTSAKLVLKVMKMTKKKNISIVNEPILKNVSEGEYLATTFLREIAYSDWENDEEFGPEKKLEIDITPQQTAFCMEFLPNSDTWTGEYEDWVKIQDRQYDDRLLKATFVEYEVTECNISDLICTQANIDNGLTFAWDSEYQEQVIVSIYKGTTLKATKTVTTAKTATFPVGAIRESGEYTVKLTGCDGVTVEEIFTFTKTIPTVSNLEPDGLSKDGRETIGISWTSAGQTSYICNVGGNTYTGTNSTNITLPANTLNYGTNNINLTVRYTTGWGEIREATTTASFTVYGPPVQPTITSSAIFSTGTPRFTWTGTGQTAYKLTVKQGISVIFTTDEIISTDKYFVATTALENNEEYQVYLQIKNKYNIWSEEAIQNITIQFNIPAKPSLNVFQGDNAIVLNILNATTPTNYKYSEIYRRDSLSDEFTRIALNLPENGAYYDYFVAHNMEYEYFARNYNQAGGYNDSDSIIITAKVQGYGLYDIENSSNKIVFYNDVNISDDFKRDIELFNMATSKAPYSERGINDYLTCKVSYKTSKLTDFHSLQKLEKTSKVLMYKDKQGRKMPCNITSNISRSVDKFGFITVGFTLTEVQFKECDYINGGNEGRELLIWNGTWKFDGTHSFGGE